MISVTEVETTVNARAQNQTWCSLSISDLAQPGQPSNSENFRKGSSLIHIRPAGVKVLNAWA